MKRTSGFVFMMLALLWASTVQARAHPWEPERGSTRKGCGESQAIADSLQTRTPRLAYVATLDGLLLFEGMSLEILQTCDHKTCTGTVILGYLVPRGLADADLRIQLPEHLPHDRLTARA